MDPVRAIADAVLYEGYILWPYRRSALKNRQRWTFGGVYPRAHSEPREDDPWRIRTECLLEADVTATLEVEVRFLQIVRREVARRVGQGLEVVDELTVGGERHLTWEEAREREVGIKPTPVAQLAAGRTVPIGIEGGCEEEKLAQGGVEAGAIVRRWETLRGEVAVRTKERSPGLHRVVVEISNTSACEAGSREQALQRTFCSAHTVLRVRGGEFASMADPPPRLAAEADACSSEGAWPVLVGEPGDRHTVLSAGIILEDHPRIAPESPGDLFDGGEIDEMLVLNILSLTDEEKDEMRDSDPKAREILERTEALSEEELMRLHGAIREFGVARR